MGLQALFGSGVPQQLGCGNVVQKRVEQFLQRSVDELLPGPPVQLAGVGKNGNMDT